MTLEEKITHLKTTSMEQARAEGNAIIDSHREALDKVFEDHKAEALRQSETRIKAETTNAKLALNQALAKSQLEIKRKQGKIQQELKDKIFEEAQDLIHAFMKTEAYDDFLIRCIRSAVRFAGTDPVTVYINLSDEKKKTALEDATQVHLSVSAEDFIGGVRSVIRSRNILIDNSFQTQLKDQYDNFIFEGGDGIGEDSNYLRNQRSRHLPQRKYRFLYVRNGLCRKAEAGWRSHCTGQRPDHGSGL